MFITVIYVRIERFKMYIFISIIKLIIVSNYIIYDSHYNSSKKKKKSSVQIHKLI